MFDVRENMKKTKMADDKWSQTGWKIEQKYGRQVLVGNWAEERLQFTRKPETAQSSNRADYRPHWDFQPDGSSPARGCAPLGAEGLPAKQLFGLCHPASSHHLLSQYEDSYGRQGVNSLPSVQTWHSKRLTRSDGPNSAQSGSIQSISEKQRSNLPSLTVYRSAFQRHPPSSFCQRRYARASRALSSHLHAAAQNNKDLELRGRSALQVPDR